MNEKLLINIRRATKHITAKQLAEEAHVSLTTEYVMEIGGFVNQEEAERVLAAFSRLTSAKYTFENVKVNLRAQARRASQRA